MLRRYYAPAIDDFTLIKFKAAKCKVKNKGLFTLKQIGFAIHYSYICIN